MKKSDENQVINSIVELLNNIDYDLNFIYRGQSIDWPLIPSIARKSISEWGYETWYDLQNDLIRRFKKWSIPYVTQQPTNNVEWLVLAQHHGLPTSLLDWSTNCIKALFFSVEDESFDTQDGVLFAFDPTSWIYDISAHLKVTDREYPNNYEVFFPDAIDSRVVAQESCYTYYPMRNSKSRVKPLTEIKIFRNIKKLIIPAKAKRGCRIELSRLGITHMSMFPGLEGVSRTIKLNEEIF